MCVIVRKCIRIDVSEEGGGDRDRERQTDRHNEHSSYAFNLNECSDQSKITKCEQTSK